MIRKPGNDAEEIFVGNFRRVEEEEDRWAAGRLSSEEVFLEEGLTIHCLVLKPSDAFSAGGNFPPCPY